jgi:TPR repeat protein
MSSPLDQDFVPAEPSRYAPRRGRNRQASGPVWADDVEVDFSAVEERPGSRYRFPRSLEPTLVPEPRWVESRSRGGGFVIALAAATAIAAVAALFVVGKVPSSWLSSAIRKGSEPHAVAASQPLPEIVSGALRSTLTERPKSSVPQLITIQNSPQTAGESARLNMSLSAPAPGAMVIIDGLASGSTLSVGRASRASGWRLMASDLPEALIRPPEEFTGTMDLLVELRLADDSVADRKNLHVEWTPPTPKAAPMAAQTSPAVPTTAVATPAAPALVLRQLDANEVAAFVRRGEEFIASGDLASARLLLQRAAESGDVGAALALAGTYDPNVLEKLGLQGLVADVAMARMWYQRAREFGSAEAPGRLEQLAHATPNP